MKNRQVNKNRPHGPGGAAKKNGSRKTSFSNNNYNGYGGRNPVYVGRKPVGYVEGQTFFKRIIGSKHLLRQPPARARSIWDRMMAASIASTRSRDLSFGDSAGVRHIGNYWATGDWCRCGRCAAALYWQTDKSILQRVFFPSWEFLSTLWMPRPVNRWPRFGCN